MDTKIHNIDVVIDDELVKDLDEDQLDDLVASVKEALVAEFPNAKYVIVDVDSGHSVSLVTETPTNNDFDVLATIARVIRAAMEE